MQEACPTSEKTAIISSITPQMKYSPIEEAQRVTITRPPRQIKTPNILNRLTRSLKKTTPATTENTGVEAITNEL